VFGRSRPVRAERLELHWNRDLRVGKVGQAVAGGEYQGQAAELLAEHVNGVFPLFDKDPVGVPVFVGMREADEPVPLVEVGRVVALVGQNHLCR